MDLADKSANMGVITWMEMILCRFFVLCQNTRSFPPEKSFTLMAEVLQMEQKNSLILKEPPHRGKRAVMDCGGELTEQNQASMVRNLEDFLSATF